MSTTAWVWAAVIIIIIALGAWWFVSQGVPTPATTNTSPTGELTGTVTAPKTVTVLYGTDGFSPSTVTINKGDTVTFVNNGGGDMWVATAQHPAHSVYDGTDRATHCAAGYTGPVPFDQCSVGINYSFMFNHAGTWNYHNHNNAADFGKVVVE